MHREAACARCVRTWAHIFWNDSSRLLDSGEQLDVLAIGDSWFHYPFNNLISPLLEALERPTIYVIGDNGARADELSTGSWLGNFRKMLAGYPQIRLVCVSAGGNDFAGGGDLDDKILAPDCSGATTVEQCYRAGEPQGVFDSVETARGDLLAAVAAVRPDLTVLVHNYDYAIPDGRALIGVRSWLKLPMDNARVPTAGAPKDRLRRDIVRDLIDRFTLCLDDVRRCPRSRWSWCGRRERLRTPVGRTSCIASLRASPRSSTTARAAPRVTRSDCPDR